MAAEKREFRILVIEDNPGDFALVEEFLSEQITSLDLVRAKNFAEAVKFLTSDNNQFDVVLLDLSLPDKTGIPLITNIVQLCIDIPVVVLTGYPDLAFGVKSLSLGISDYMLKEELTSVSLYKSILYSKERKKVISELEVSEKNYNELFHMSPLPMFVFDLGSLNFLDANAAFIKHYGYNKGELLRMNLRQIRPSSEIPTLEEGLRIDDNCLKKTSFGVYKHLKRNGEIIHVDIRSNFISYKGKKAKVTIATDITERLNYVKAVEEQNEKLQEISWIQSHIVRAPLARLMGLIDLLKNTANNSEINQMLEYISLSANELDDVIKDITYKTAIKDDARSNNGLLV
ncbi:MAG TPA: response regulator [Mucilaginibacter sp.]|jgi:PAS domain S-box-containing protein